MKNKKLFLIVVIIENILLALVKFWTIASYALAAFLDDYIIPLTTIQKIVTFGTGILIAIVIDFFVNFIIYKVMNKKEKIISYKRLVIVSLIITALESIFLLPL